MGRKNQEKTTNYFIAKPGQFIEVNKYSLFKQFVGSVKLKKF